MVDSCSSSSEEEHAVLLGVLTLQQINDEEDKEKPKKQKQLVCKLCPDGCTAISIYSWPVIVHKDTAMRDTIPPAERRALTLRFLATKL